MRLSLCSALLASAALATTVVTPREAKACGGFFCDGGGPPMPVDQTGEVVLFSVNGSSVDAHIQIAYEGEPEKFSWVIPLMSEPEFSVGSQPLINSLLVASQPQFLADHQYDDCGVDDPNRNDGEGATGAAGSDGGGDEGGTGGDDGGVQVVSRQTVGAFEAVVLQGGTAEEVVEWLDANGYQQDPEALPILAEYVEENMLFAALKLTGGADVDEIHPIVLSFDIGEACVPLRLTRIAAVENMDVRTLFLASNRAAPTNFRHVLVNPVRVDWLNNGSNYSDIVTAAVDEEHADGRAFVTEYAGPSAVVAGNTRNFVFNAVWDDTRFRDIEPTGVMDELQNQNMGGCFGGGGGCQWGHPLVLSVLREFLPAPQGIEEDEFYGNIQAYADSIDLEVWDPIGFADAYKSRIIDPGQKALETLDSGDYLTRMFTTISPAEMTEDPIFHINSELADVQNQQVATIRHFCSGDMLATLPDDRQVFLPAGTTTWPDFDDEMPFSQEIAAIPEFGVPDVLADKSEAIDAALAKYNDGTEVEGGTDGSAPGDGTTGCACNSGDAGTTGAAGFALMSLGLLGLRRRRTC